MDVFRTLIVPNNRGALAKALAGGLSRRGVGMFTAKLSPTGSNPATHLVSTGFIAEEMAVALTDANLLFAAANQRGAPITLEQCQALVNESDVSQQNPFVAFARLGLQMIHDQTQEEIE